MAEVTLPTTLDEQRLVDEQRKKAAWAIVDALPPGDLEAARHCAAAWIQTAMQHSANESFFQGRAGIEELRAVEAEGARDAFGQKAAQLEGRCRELAGQVAMLEQRLATR
jgi:hypothetical protein